MLRIALFAALVTGGVVLFQSAELLAQNEAVLVSAVIATAAVFAIPEEKKKREPRALLINLIAVIGFYGIWLKFRPWLATAIHPWIAMLISVLLFLGVMVTMLVLKRVRGIRSQTPDAS